MQNPSLPANSQHSAASYEEALSAALSKISVVSRHEATLTENRGQGAFICDHRSGPTHATAVTSLQKFAWLLAKREKPLPVMIDLITERFEDVSAVDAVTAISDLVRGGFLKAELISEPAENPDIIAFSH